MNGPLVLHIRCLALSCWVSGSQDGICATPQGDLGDPRESLTKEKYVPYRQD